MRIPFLLFVLAIITSQKAVSLCVTSNKANLRSGPGTNFSISWEVLKYMPFRVLKKQKGWYRVKDVDGDVHWIFSKLVSKSLKCAVVKVKMANLRTGPGTKYSHSKVYPKAKKFDSFKLLKTKGKWARLEDEDKDRYWVFRELIWVQ